MENEKMIRSGGMKPAAAFNPAALSFRNRRNNTDILDSNK
jgi:hypothetical protein